MANIILGLYSPYRHNKTEEFGYNIKEWKDNIRFLSVIGNREGGCGGVCPLLFDGATNTFMVLPEPNRISKLYYDILSRIKNPSYIVRFTLTYLTLQHSLYKSTNLFNKLINKLKQLWVRLS